MLHVNKLAKECTKRSLFFDALELLNSLPVIKNVQIYIVLKDK